MIAVGETITCERCEETIYRYCHSEYGTTKVYAWTTISSWSEYDQRYGTTCDEIYRHIPEQDGDE